MSKLDVSWHIRHSKESDFEGISQLRKQFSSEEGSDRRSCEPSYYKWKLLDNPSNGGLLNVSDDSGEVVGITTLTPKYFITNSGVHLGAEIGDTYTHKDFQRQGMFSKLVNFTREQASQSNIELIYGTPNHLSLPGYRKLEFCEVSNVDLYNWVMPINFRNVIMERFKNKVLATIGSPLLSLIYSVIFKNSNFKKSYKISKITEFPPEIDQLTEKARKKYGWLIQRDKKYLDWRFCSNPDNYDIWVCQLDNQITGYLVAKMGKFSTLKVGYIADFLIDEAHLQAFDELCATSIDYFRTNHVDLISSWAIRGDCYHKSLAKFGFIKFKPVPIICDNHNLGSQLLAEPVKWHFTMADSDNI